MYKKITGVDEGTIRERQRDAKEQMNDYLEHLRGKKDEYRSMKASNEMEREELRRLEKQAASFKFTKMSKKAPFFPSLHTRGNIEEKYVTTTDNAIGYLDGRTKESLIFPNRVKDYTKQFKQITTCDGEAFKKEAKQETETYDLVLQKYMRTQDRGLPRPIHPKSGFSQSIHVPKETVHLGSTKGIFRSTDPDCYLLQKSTPLLLDRSNTPRGAFRQISLDRNYTNQRWLYNKNLGHDFDPMLSKKEEKRNKNLRKITKKEDKNKEGKYNMGGATLSSTCFEDSRKINTAN